MKNFIICLLLFSFSFVTMPSLAQSDSTNISKTNTERVVDKCADRVEGAIISLANTLKTPAEHVYKVLVKQQVIYSINGVISFLAVLVTGLIFLILGYKKWQYARNNSYRDSDFNEGPWCGLIVAGYILIGISLLIIMFGLDCIVTGFINPEYGAIKEILKVIQ